MKIRRPLAPILNLVNVESGTVFVLTDRPDCDGQLFMKVAREDGLFNHSDDNYHTIINVETGAVREFNSGTVVILVDGDYLLTEGEYE